MASPAAQEPGEIEIRCQARRLPTAVAAVSLYRVIKRRGFKCLRPDRWAEHHHHVYVVLLDSAVARLRKVMADNSNRDPARPCVDVGMSGLTPEVIAHGVWNPLPTQCNPELW